MFFHHSNLPFIHSGECCQHLEKHWLSVDKKTYCEEMLFNISPSPITLLLWCLTLFHVMSLSIFTYFTNPFLFSVSPLKSRQFLTLIQKRFSPLLTCGSQMRSLGFENIMKQEFRGVLVCKISATFCSNFSVLSPRISHVI